MIGLGLLRWLPLDVCLLRGPPLVRLLVRSVLRLYRPELLTGDHISLPLVHLPPSAVPAVPGHLELRGHVPVLEGSTCERPPICTRFCTKLEGQEVGMVQGCVDFPGILQGTPALHAGCRGFESLIAH